MRAIKATKYFQLIDTPDHIVTICIGATPLHHPTSAESVEYDRKDEIDMTVEEIQEMFVGESEIVYDQDNLPVEILTEYVFKVKRYDFNLDYHKTFLN